MSSRTESQRAPIALAAILFAALLWGTTGICSKLLNGFSITDPIAIGFYRMVLAVPPLAAASWLTLGRGLFSVTRRELLTMFLMGAMLALYQACFFASVARTGVAIATVITLCSAPILTALLSALLLREWPSRRLLLSLTLAVAGTLLLIGWQSQPVAGGGSATLAGTLLALSSATGYAVMTLAGRTIAQRSHPLQTTTISFAFSALILFVVALPNGLTFELRAEAWLLLIYLGLLPSALGYVIFVWAMRYTPATVATIVTLIEPLTATVLARLIFGERLSATALAGACLLAGAMLLLFTARRPITQNQEAH